MEGWIIIHPIRAPFSCGPLPNLHDHAAESPPQTPSVAVRVQLQPWSWRFPARFIGKGRRIGDAAVALFSAILVRLHHQETVSITLSGRSPVMRPCRVRPLDLSGPSTPRGIPHAFAGRYPIPKAQTPAVGPLLCLVTQESLLQLVAPSLDNEDAEAQ